MIWYHMSPRNDLPMGTILKYPDGSLYVTVTEKDASDEYEISPIRHIGDSKVRVYYFEGGRVSFIDGVTFLDGINAFELLAEALDGV